MNDILYFRSTIQNDLPRRIKSLPYLRCCKVLFAVLDDIHIHVPAAQQMVGIREQDVDLRDKSNLSISDHRFGLLDIVFDHTFP